MLLAWSILAGKRSRGTAARAFHIDCGSIQHIGYVDGVMFLDHFNGGTAVFGQLINVGPLHETLADVIVTERIKSMRLTVSIELDIIDSKDSVEQLDVIAGEDLVLRLRHRNGDGNIRRPRLLRSWLSPLGNPLRAIEKTLIGFHGIRSALAVTSTAFAANLDKKNEFVGRFVFQHLHVAMFKVLGFVRA